MIQFRIPEASEKAFNAKVYLVGKSIDDEKRTIRVHGHLENEDEANFLPGMFVEAIIMTDTSQNLSLPEEAIIESEGSFYVLRLVDQQNGNHVFERVSVKHGSTFDGYTEIFASELNETDQFLTKGVFDLIGG